VSLLLWAARAALGARSRLGLADAGADVVATARRAALIDDVANAIEAKGRRTLRIATDVLDRGRWERACDAVLRAFGQVDVVVYAAGINKRVPTIDMTDEDWERVIGTNLTGAVRTYQVFAKPMIARSLVVSSHRVVVLVRRAERSQRVHGVEGRRRRTHTRPRCGVGAAWRARERDRARRISHGAECQAARRPRGQEFLLRTPMRRYGHLDELGGRRHLSGVRRVQLRDRPDHCR
jgi:hypothetical protein